MKRSAIFNLPVCGFSAVDLMDKNPQKSTKIHKNPTKMFLNYLLPAL